MQKETTLDPVNKDSPLVSIITSTYNAHAYLNDCINSVLIQKYKNIEYIIIDGGSTDDTVDLIKLYNERITYWVSEPDLGIYDAWNKGLAVSKGEWICFVGADDILEADAIETYVNHILQHPNRSNLEFVSSRIELVNEDLSHVDIVGAPWQWERFKKEMITWHLGCFHSRQFFKNYGTFNTNYKICGDYELLLRAKDKLTASFIDKLTAKMRIGGVSSVKLNESIEETYQAKVAIGLINPLTGFILTRIDKVRIFIRNTIGLKIV